MKSFIINKKKEKIWMQVPPDYYEKGIATNILQFIWHNWKWVTMKKILQKINPAPAKILDIGCASGHITAKIAKFFPVAQVSGLDTYKQAIEFGRKIHPEVKFKIGDAENLPFKNESFELVTCIETLEHLENPKKALLEIKRVLKSAGCALVGQDTDNWLFRLVWFFWTKIKGKVWQGSHLHPLHTKHLQELIKKTGLKIQTRKFSQAGLEVFFLARKN